MMKFVQPFPAGIYVLNVNNRNTRTRCEKCSKLTIKTPERSPWRQSDVFIVNFEHISHLVLFFLWLTLNMPLTIFPKDLHHRCLTGSLLLNLSPLRMLIKVFSFTTLSIYFSTATDFTFWNGAFEKKIFLHSRNLALFKTIIACYQKLNCRYSSNRNA